MVIRRVVQWFAVFTLLATDIAHTQPAGMPSPQAYIHLPAGTRATSLNGAFAAIANDPTTLWFNPAGLAILPSAPQFSLMATARSFQRMLNTFSYAQQLFSSVGIGAGIIHHDAGRIIARDGNGTIIGQYRNTQLLAQAGIAYQYGTVAVGITGKYLLHLLSGPNIRADGYAFDVGILFRAPYFSLGFAARNLGGTMIWNNLNRDKEVLPYTLSAAAAIEIPFATTKTVIRTILGTKKTIQKRSAQYLLLTLEGRWIQREAHTTVVFGIELAPVQELQFRLGLPIAQPYLTELRYFVLRDLTFGFSIQPRLPQLPFAFQIDYAMSPDYLTATSRWNHHFGITLLWW